MKRVLTLAIAFITTLTLVACSNNSSSVQQESAGNNKNQLNISTKRVLVAYFAREVNTQKNTYRCCIRS